jgi:hypothetical protein
VSQRRIQRRKSIERARIAKGEMRAREIVARRLRGESFSMIATAMRMALSSVHEGYTRGLNAICPPDSLVEARRRQARRTEIEGVAATARQESGGRGRDGRAQNRGT